jgi:nitrite reductase/ring-hydroxylating ferredoxin subunit
VIVDVGAVTEFEEGRPRIMTVEGREIGVVRWRGEFYAVRNLCPHQLGPVCGVVHARLDADRPGELVADDDNPVVGCPWHGWEFDLRTGRSMWDDQFRIRTYPTSTRAGRLMVEFEDRGRTRRPARASTAGGGAAASLDEAAR